MDPNSFCSKPCKDMYRSSKNRVEQITKAIGISEGYKEDILSLEIEYIETNKLLSVLVNIEHEPKAVPKIININNKRLQGIMSAYMVSQLISIAETRALYLRSKCDMLIDEASNIKNEKNKR